MKMQRPFDQSDAAARARLHVLMLLDGAYPPPKGGGTEMQARLLAKSLRQRGHQVTVLAPLTARGPQRRIERIDGIPVCRLPFPRIRFVGGLWLMSRLGLFLWSKRARYDVWHVHSPRRLGAVAALLGSRLRPRVVIKVASASELERGNLAPQPTPLARALFYCLRQADAWQAISRRIADALVARGVPNSCVAAIPNGVDVGRFSPRHHRASGHPRFLFVGRLAREKNLFGLLRGFAALLQSHPQARLCVVGGGPLEAELKDLVAVLGIDSRVEFMGHRDDVEVLLSRADVGVLPSNVEGLSNALLECMASGLPMIASRVSGSEDLVTAANGWLFEPGDDAGLETCLAEAAAMPWPQLRQMGAIARDTVERHASLDSVLDRMLALYVGPVAMDAAPRLPHPKALQCQAGEIGGGQ